MTNSIPKNNVTFLGKSQYSLGKKYKNNYILFEKYLSFHFTSKKDTNKLI